MYSTQIEFNMKCEVPHPPDIIQNENVMYLTHLIEFIMKCHMYLTQVIAFNMNCHVLHPTDRIQCGKAQVSWKQNKLLCTKDLQPFFFYISNKYLSLYLFDSMFVMIYNILICTASFDRGLCLGMSRVIKETAQENRNTCTVDSA